MKLHFEPEILFVVCNKKHSVKLARDVNGRLENPLPGEGEKERIYGREESKGERREERG